MLRTPRHPKRNNEPPATPTTSVHWNTSLPQPAARAKQTPFRSAFYLSQWGNDESPTMKSINNHFKRGGKENENTSTRLACEELYFVAFVSRSRTGKGVRSHLQGRRFDPVGLQYRELWQDESGPQHFNVRCADCNSYSMVLSLQQLVMVQCHWKLRFQCGWFDKGGTRSFGSRGCIYSKNSRRPPEQATWRDD